MSKVIQTMIHGAACVPLLVLTMGNSLTRLLKTEAVTLIEELAFAEKIRYENI